MLKKIGIFLFAALIAFALLKVRCYRILSDSMAPAISSGDVAIVFRTKSLKRGDIGAYSHPKDSRMTIVHRVFYVRGDTFYFKGDANNVIDYQTIQKNLVIGKVVLVIPLSELKSIF